MKLHFLSFVIVITMPLASYAQWLPSGAAESAFLYRSGNVALGLTSTLPYKLNVKGDATNSPLNIIGGGASGTESLLTVHSAPGGSSYFNVAAFYGKSNGTNSTDSYFAIKAISKTGTGWSPGVTVYSGGNVGIGTFAPISTLDVAGQSGNTNDRNFRVTYPNGGNLLNSELSALANVPTVVGGNGWTSLYAKQGNAAMAAVFDGQVSFQNGNVGIGNALPQETLHVTGNFRAGGLAKIGRSGSHYDEFGFNVGFTSTNEQYTYTNTDYAASMRLGWNGDIEFRTAPQGTAGASLTLTTRMIFKQNGNLLIGKTSQTNTAYKLDVNGSVRSNEVVVNTNGADFVFDQDYKLMPLEQLSLFIGKHRHLPEIAPAADMQQNGVEIGKLQSQLLQKIEELTLYLIQQNENVHAQNEKIIAQEELIKSQQLEIQELREVAKRLVAFEKKLEEVSAR